MGYCLFNDTAWGHGAGKGVLAMGKQKRVERKDDTIASAFSFKSVFCGLRFLPSSLPGSCEGTGLSEFLVDKIFNTKWKRNEVHNSISACYWKSVFYGWNGWHQTHSP